jgi:2-oxo-4-hydroxy-4-carboxy-5-ureidoimidazoline decarboxylase
VTLAELNACDRPRFVDRLGLVFEDSPWVASRAWARRPFADVAQLLAAMVGEVAAATRQEQLALLRAHPDLGTRARMSDASVAEQAGAGLDRLTPEEFERLRRLTSEYRDKFGFPFLLAVKGRSTLDILRALELRVTSTPEQEWTDALAQVSRIAQWRLHDMVKP